MKELKEAQMGIIAVLALMLVSIKRRLPTRKLSSGITTLALAGIVLLVAAGSASAADCSNAIGGPGSCNCGDTVTGDYTFNGDMVCTDGTTYGLIVGASGITIDGDGFSMTGAISGSVCLDGITGGDTGEQSPAKHSGIISQFDNVVIKNIEIKNFCGGIGIGDMANNDVENNTVIGCNIHDCGDSVYETQGIHMVYTSNCSITKNDVHSIDGDGISGGCTGGGNGIFMYGKESTARGWYNNFTCNNLHNNVKSGFFMKHQCMHNTISYNNASDNAQAGIMPKCDKSNHNTFEYNTMIGNTVYGFFTNGDDNTIRYNTIKSATGSGLVLGPNSGAVVGANSVTHNCVCNGNNQDIVNNSLHANTGDENTCVGGPAGWCDWNCGNNVPVYFDFDEDGDYSNTTANCSCSLDCGGQCACCNPGMFDGSTGAMTSYEASCDCQWDYGTDPCDCNKSITGPKKPNYIVSAVGRTWLDDSHYNVTYTVENIGNKNATESSNTSISVGSTVKNATPPLNMTETSYGEVGPFACTDLTDTVNVTADCDGEIGEQNEGDNSNTSLVVTCKLPDYRIIDKYETWIDEAAKTYNITYLICNNGTRDGTQNTITKVGTTGKPDKGVPPIPMGTCIWRVVNDSSPVQQQVYTMSGAYDVITLTANRGSGTWMPELNQFNNSITNTFYGAVVVEIDPCPVDIYVGIPKTVNISLSNIADYGSGTIHMYYDKDMIRPISVGLGDSNDRTTNPQDMLDAEGHVRISAHSDAGLDGTVEFVNVTFMTAPGATSGCTYLNLTVETLYDRNYTALQTVVNNCTSVCIVEQNVPYIPEPPSESPYKILSDTGRARVQQSNCTNMTNLSVRVTDDTQVAAVYVNLTPILGGNGINDMVPMNGTPSIDGVWYLETNASNSSPIPTPWSPTPHILNVMAVDCHDNWNNGSNFELAVLKRGDVSSYAGATDRAPDNAVDMQDYYFIARYSVGLEAPDIMDTTDRRCRGEIVGLNGAADSWNGIDMADALYIALYSVNPITYPAP